MTSSDINYDHINFQLVIMKKKEKSKRPITAPSMVDVPTAHYVQSAVYRWSHQVYKKDEMLITDDS